MKDFEIVLKFGDGLQKLCLYPFFQVVHVTFSCHSSVSGCTHSATLTLFVTASKSTIFFLKAIHLSE